MVQASAPYSKTLSTVALKTLSFVCMEQVDFQTRQSLSAIVNAMARRTSKSFWDDRVQLPRYLKSSTIWTEPSWVDSAAVASFISPMRMYTPSFFG